MNGKHYDASRGNDYVWKWNKTRRPAAPPVLPYRGSRTTKNPDADCLLGYRIALTEYYNERERLDLIRQARRGGKRAAATLWARYQCRVWTEEEVAAENARRLATGTATGTGVGR